MNNIKTDRISGKITLANGSVITFDDSHVVQGSLYITNQCVSGYDFMYGAVYAAEAGITLITTISRYSLFDAKLEITYELETTPGVFTKYPMGVYFISQANRVGNKISIKALDAMLNLDVEIEEDSSGKPFDLLKRVAAKTGVQLGQTQEQIEAFPNGTELFAFRFERIDTYRDAVSYLAQLLCAFATIDGAGKLILKRFSIENPRTIQQSLRKDTQVSDFETYYQGLQVRFIAEENFYPYDHVIEGVEGGLVLDLGDNPIVHGVPETKYLILANMAEDLKHIKYVPCECKFFGDPLIELGGLVTYQNAGGIDALSYVHYYKWIYRGLTQIKAGGANPKLKTVHDKTWKQLVNMEADISLRDIVIYAYENASDYTISEAEKEIINLQFTSVKETRTIFLGNVQFELSHDGMVDVFFYRDMVLQEHMTKSGYFSKGQNFISLNDSFEVAGNARNELSVRLATRAIESASRIQQAAITNLSNKFDALLVATAENPYIEPESVTVDTTVPTLTIASQRAKGLLYAQGLNANTFVWDGTFTINEKVPTFEMGIPAAMTLGKIIERVNTIVQTPIGAPITEKVPTFTMGTPQAMTLGAIREFVSASEIIQSDSFDIDKTTNFDSEFVEIIGDSFVLRRAYQAGPSVEVAIDSGRMCELAIETDKFERVDGIEVIT